MNTIKTTIAMIIKKPLLLLYMSLICLVTVLVGHFNFIPGVLIDIFNKFEGNTIENIMEIYKYITTNSLILPLFLTILGTSLVIAILAGLFLSPYLYMVNNFLNRTKVKNAFILGIKKYFISIFGATFSFFFLASLILAGICIMLIPALVITRASMEAGNNMTTASIFINILTGAIIFFIILFFRTYFVSWFPAIFIDKKNSFDNAKEFASGYFWRISAGTLIFDIILVLFFLIFVTINTTVIFLIIKWIFLTLFFSAFVVYFFTLYKTLRE